MRVRRAIKGTGGGKNRTFHYVGVLAAFFMFCFFFFSGFSSFMRMPQITQFSLVFFCLMIGKNRNVPLRVLFTKHVFFTLHEHHAARHRVTKFFYKSLSEGRA
jgi:hypothetical protein